MYSDNNQTNIKYYNCLHYAVSRYINAQTTVSMSTKLIEKYNTVYEEVYLKDKKLTQRDRDLYNIQSSVSWGSLASLINYCANNKATKAKATEFMQLLTNSKVQDLTDLRTKLSDTNICIISMPNGKNPHYIYKHGNKEYYEKAGFSQTPTQAKSKPKPDSINGIWG